MISTLQLRVASFIYYLIEPEPFLNYFINLWVVIVDDIKPNILLYLKRYIDDLTK